MVASSIPLPGDSYVAVLKAKRAELDAISTAPADRLVPLLEVIDPEGAPAAIAKSWPHRDHIVWVQVLNPEGTEDAVFAVQVEQLFAALRAENLLAVPVITPTEEVATLAAVSRVASTDGRGVVLRIDVEELIDETINSAADFEATLDGLSLGRPEVDVVLDAGLLSGTAVVQAAVASQGLRELPFADGWRTVVVAFSAFPEAVGEVVARESVAAIPRIDAAAFVATARASAIPLVYADYTVGVPTYGGAPFTPIPNIRYASGADWFVHRAKERKGSGPQYRKLAADVLSAAYYAGPAFSPGDKQISDVASGTAGPGNATTHLRIAVSRHVHVVLDRLSTLGVP